MSVKFGKKQLQNPTPKGVGNAFDIASAILGAAVGYISTAPYIPADITIVLSSIFGFLITLVQILKPFFGVKTRLKKVNIEDVTEMNEPDKVDISHFPPSSKVPAGEHKDI